MKTKKRYTVGFEDKDVTSLLTASYPDLIPVVDHKSVFAFGMALALCNTVEDAEKLANKLNKLDEIENLMKNHEN